MPRKNITYKYPEEEFKQGAESGFRHWLQGRQETAASALQSQKASEASALQERLLRRKREDEEREAAEAGPAIQSFIPSEAKERLGIRPQPGQEAGLEAGVPVTETPLKLTPGSLGIFKTMLPKLIEQAQTPKQEWVTVGQNLYNPRTGEWKAPPMDPLTEALTKRFGGSGAADPFESQPEVTVKTPGGSSMRLEQVGSPERRAMMQQAREAFPNDPAKARTEFIRLSRDYEKEIAGAKAEGALPWKPLGEKAQEALTSYQKLLGTLGELESFSPADIQSFAGIWNKGESEFKSILAEAARKLTGAPVPDRVQKYLAFKAVTKRLKATAFDYGGKQLTPFEAGVVFGFTPTGEEYAGPAEFLAKVKLMNQLLPIIYDMHLWAASAPRNQVMAEYNMRLQNNLKRAGIPIPKAALGKMETPTFYWHNIERSEEKAK